MSILNHEVFVYVYDVSASNVLSIIGAILLMSAMLSHHSMFDVSCSHGWYAVSTTVFKNINQITLSATELLLVSCEHHFATIRSRYPTPKLLQYCQLQNDVMAVLEADDHSFTGTASY